MADNDYISPVVARAIMLPARELARRQEHERQERTIQIALKVMENFEILKKAGFPNTIVVENVRVAGFFDNLLNKTRVPENPHLVVRSTTRGYFIPNIANFSINSFTAVDTVKGREVRQFDGLIQVVGSISIGVSLNTQRNCVTGTGQANCNGISRFAARAASDVLGMAPSSSGGPAISYDLQIHQDPLLSLSANLQGLVQAL